MTTPTENTTENKQQQNDDQELTQWGVLSPDSVQKHDGFNELPEKRYRINPKRTLQSLIPQFSSLKMVMYVQRVDFIRDLFDEYEGPVTMETTANDVAQWDSLSHVRLMVMIEMELGVHFSTSEMQSFKNLGDLVRAAEKQNA